MKPNDALIRLQVLMEAGERRKAEKKLLLPWRLTAVSILVGCAGMVFVNTSGWLFFGVWTATLLCAWFVGWCDAK